MVDQKEKARLRDLMWDAQDKFEESKTPENREAMRQAEQVYMNYALQA